MDVSEEIQSVVERLGVPEYNPLEDKGEHLLVLGTEGRRYDMFKVIHTLIDRVDAKCANCSCKGK